MRGPGDRAGSAPGTGPRAAPFRPDARLAGTRTDDLADLFARLGRSRFRSRFRLGDAERAYLRDRGLETVLRHAGDFVERRLAPARPARDGKQTPYRGHPVFVAQHATATCCRGCLERWHGIPRGEALSPARIAHVLGVIERWLVLQEAGEPPER